MDLSNLKVDAAGYLCTGAGERAIFYTCDPAKNFLCGKGMCRGGKGAEDEAEFGFCASTPEPAFKADGSRPFYKRLNADGYFGREYLWEA